MINKSKTFDVKTRRVISGTQLRQYWVITSIWLIVNALFWTWWLNPQNIGNPILFTLISFALGYELTVLPSFYLFFLFHMRRPYHVAIQRVIRTGIVKKVAMITLTVPGSESLSIVKKQLRAMKAVKHPHDSWILVDKIHSPEIEKLAQSLGVKYFCRHDSNTWGKTQVEKWNQPNPPFKAKTKAGNVNAWIDAFGEQYSHFTQLDIDHIPKKDYLHQVLGFFLDPKIAWVQAPSVYGNLKDWTARGSAEQELVLQGPLQMGFYGFCKTPFIIGSHCTYEMAAIKQIGGFQPTRAEDHLDTVFLAANQRQGVFLPRVIAVGDGPESFETYMAQQFAWAYSMIQVLFSYTPKCIKNYTLRQSIQFLFVQTWYTLWSTSMALLFTIPIFALFSNTEIAHVDFTRFTLFTFSVSAVAFGIWIWSHKWHYPKRIGLTWSGIILHIARWPIVFSAFMQVLLKVQKPYMITIKGMHNGIAKPFHLQSHLPYFILVFLSLTACWYYILEISYGFAQGYLLFALQGSLVILLVYITALTRDFIDLRSQNVSLKNHVSLRAKPMITLCLMLIAIIYTSIASSSRIGEAVFEIPTQNQHQSTLINPYVYEESP